MSPPTRVRRRSPGQPLETLVAELINNAEVRRRDRKDVQEVLGWLRSPGQVDARELIEDEVRHLEWRIQTADYAKRPEGRRRLLRTARSLRKLARTL